MIMASNVAGTSRWEIPGYWAQLLLRSCMESKLMTHVVFDQKIGSHSRFTRRHTNRSHFLAAISFPRSFVAR